jgi:hypothetical protein
MGGPEGVCLPPPFFFSLSFWLVAGAGAAAAVEVGASLKTVQRRTKATRHRKHMRSAGAGEGGREGPVLLMARQEARRVEEGREGGSDWEGKQGEKERRRKRGRDLPV